MTTYVPADDIREQFTEALSAHYQQEVPVYRELLELTSDVNLAVLEKESRLHQDLVNNDELGRLQVERHGALCLGRGDELALIGEVLAVMGMAPVGYYDLAAVGVPVHATAFRATGDSALCRNPFRMFVALLRLELIADDRLRKKALSLLARREMFTPGCRQLLGLHARQGGLDARQVREFIREVLATLRWHQRAQVDAVTWQALMQEHRLFAEVVSFSGSYVNHLAPRTLDIDRAQALMPEYGMVASGLIEGPPRRQFPLLLRQTRFQAQTESVRFSDGSSGELRVRFGELEQRGVALTPKGRALYDQLLADAGFGEDNLSHQLSLQQAFAAFPDDDLLMRRMGLAYYRYRLTPVGEAHRHAIAPGDDPQALLERGWLTAQPILYEDFLPVSAAGIYHGNMPPRRPAGWSLAGDRQAFEQALGSPLLDPFALYADSEARSKRRCGLL